MATLGWPSSRRTPECGLAFEAPKAARTVLNAEVEWAKAADTVDDVLGDFF